MSFILDLKNTIEVAYSEGITRILDFKKSDTEITGRFLDGPELFSFKINAEGVEFTPLKTPRKDAGIVGSLAQSQGLTELIRFDSLAYWTGYLLSRERRDRDCENNCEKGRQCGRSCVARGNSCKVKTPLAKRMAQSLLRRGSPSGVTKIEAIEEELRLNSYETAVCLDDQGNEVLRKGGNGYSVMFNAQEMAVMKGKVVTHNHPSALFLLGKRANDYSGGSFSPEDWNFAAVIEAKELRVVAPEGRYILQPPKEGWNADWWEKKGAPAYAESFRETHAEITKGIRAGRIDPKKANVQMWGAVSEKTAQKLGLTYRHEPQEITQEDRNVIDAEIRKRSRKISPLRIIIGSLTGLGIALLQQR